MSTSEEDMNNNSLVILKRQSVVIDSMRFPLIFLVVFVHMLPFEQSGVKLSWDTDEIYILISEMFSHNLGRLAVPCFFLISGYYFFRKRDANISKFFIGQFGKKWHSLLLPFLIWNLVSIAAILLKHHLFVKLGLGPDRKYETLQNASLYKLFWGMPVNFPLWYVRDLICMVLLSPLFYILFKHVKYFGMILIGSLYFANIETQIPGLSATALFFFGLGSYLAFNQINLLHYSVKYKLLNACLALVLLCSSTLMNGTIYHEYIIRIFSFFGLLSLINLFDYLNKNEMVSSRLTNLAPIGFFIYVTHEIYILNWLKGAASRLPIIEYGWGKLLMYFLLPVLCILVCAGIYQFLKRVVPSLLTISLGGRLLPNTTNIGRSIR